MKTIKVRLNQHHKMGEIEKLARVEEVELLEDRPNSVLVKLSNGDVIVRKKPHQVATE